LLFAFCLGACAPLLAAELRVFCPSPLREPVLELARGFVHASGDRITFVFASVGAVHKRIASGEKADMAIATLQGANALVGLGRGVQDSETRLVRSTLALVLARGAIPADIGSPEGLTSALMSARSIVIPDAALGVPGGAHAAELLDQLGIGESLRAKIRPVADAREVLKQVGTGAADAGLGAMSEVTASGLTVLGPLVEPRPAGIVYAALMVRGSAQPEAVRNFIVHLRSPQAAAIFRKAGYLHVE
jgi:molybdate transport system substrate-binding protein